MKTILFAEDTEELRELMADALRRAGFKVIEAKNGAEALRLFKAIPEIQAVLTDLEMPMLNGVQLCQEVQKIDPTVPVIMWSGAQNPGIAGLSSFFAKETGTKPVVAMLNALLDLTKAA